MSDMSGIGVAANVIQVINAQTAIINAFGSGNVIIDGLI
jgi:hypothetical protein